MKLYSVCYSSSVSSQYCSERGERVPLSLYILETRREGTIVIVLYFHFMTLQSTDARENFPRKSTRFLTFSTNHRYESKVLLLSLLLIHSVLHFIIFSMPNRPRKPPFSMSMLGKNFYFTPVHRPISPQSFTFTQMKILNICIQKINKTRLLS